MEWLPLPRWQVNDQGDYQRRWRWHRGRHRIPPENTQIHHSVRLRQALQPGYAQEWIPDSARWVD